MRWILLIVIMAAALGFWYGWEKKTEADAAMRQNDSIASVNRMLADSLLVESTKFKVLAGIADSLVTDISEKKANLIIISQKYEKSRNTYKHLFADSSISVLTNYLARENSRRD